MWGKGFAPGRGRARYVVLVGAVAVFDARMAGRDAGAEDVLSDDAAGDRLRHNFFLGRADDDARDQVRGRYSVPRRLYNAAGARPVRQEDDEVARQRGRPA